MKDSSYGEARESWWKTHRKTILMLAFLVLLATAFRVGFNYDPAINDGDYRYAGNDDYYHLWVVERVQQSGNHVNLDPMLNYPAPAKNPRPPLYDWHVAIVGQIFGFFSGEASPGSPALDAGQYALLWGSAFWGALTIIPIWLLGRATFGNRAGLWGAFLMAASPAHIQRSGFGLGDHDAFIVFFICLGAYFLVRALQATRGTDRVVSWGSFDSIATGFGTYASRHRIGLAYAFLAGVSWAAIGLSWEGYPYVLAIYAVYYVFQLVSNQMRQRDSTGDFLVFAIIVALNFLLTIPYYWITGNTHSTLTSTVYVIAILLVLSLALIPTRDLPSILVLPSLVGVGLAGFLMLFLIAPDVGNQLVSANGYFNQSKLYSTIAEAQRTELGYFVFSVGLMTFFFALVGFFFALAKYVREKDRAVLFLVGWAVLSLYMGFAATRFVFNAAPVFSVLAGWVTVRVIDRIDFKERLKLFQSLRHDSFLKATRSTMGAKQIAGAIFLVFTLIVPNVWFSVDAGFPHDARIDYTNNHPGAREFIEGFTGAFGQGFLDTNWLVVYGWLSQQDNDKPPQQRPGHIAWWDYGFWEIQIGKHPTVADNFQNGHRLAGRFLAAQSEKEAIDWLSIRLLEGDWASNQRKLSAPVRAYLAQFDAALPDRLQPLVNPDHYDDAYAILALHVTTLDESVQMYEDLQRVTGWSIQYFLTDERMWPYDDPRRPGIERGSILYAPLYLANENPDDFVQTVYVDASGREYEVKAYDVDANGNSFQTRPVQILDSGGNCYLASGGQLFRATKDCGTIDYAFNVGEGIDLDRNVFTRLRLKDAYYNTMFYKGYVGGGKPQFGDYPVEFLLGQTTAGKDMRHFRLVNGTASVKLLQYYAGAVVSGTARTSDGQPMAGYTVTALDPFGVPHDRVVTGADGSYSLLAPFALPGEEPVRIQLLQGTSEITNQTIDISRAAAQRRADYNFTLNFSVAPGDLTVFVYEDRDRSGSFNASVDAPMGGAQVTVDGRQFTTGADGRVVAAQVLPGSKSVSVTRSGYGTGTGQATLEPGGAAETSVAMTASLIAVNGTIRSQSGTGLSGFNVEFAAERPAVEHTRNTSAFTDEAGFFEANVVPGGSYKLTFDQTTFENNMTVRYKGETTIRLTIGQGPLTIPSGQWTITRTEEPA